MQAPMIHLNGTSKETLIEGYCEAGNAVMNALKAVSENCPNARDYYPLGQEAWKIAIA